MKTSRREFIASTTMGVAGTQLRSEASTGAFRLVATGSWIDLGPAPAGFDKAFSHGLQGWNVVKGGSAAAYHFAVRRSGKFLVAIGFYDPQSKPGTRVQNVVIDGRLVDTLDPAGERKPFVRLYPAEDINGDGLLEVSCSHAQDEAGITGMMNIIWVFDARQAESVDAGGLARGENHVAPLYRADYASESGPAAGHVEYPLLSDEVRKKMLPMRPVLLDLKPARPQPADPLDVEIRGELADRIQTVLDRWGFAGRDQKLVAGFLSDSGFEIAGRYLETLCLLSRLTKRDFELQVPFEALLARQDVESEHPGAFVGGQGKPRAGCSWAQGIAMGALLAYYEYSGGDPRATEAATRIVNWIEALLDGKFKVESWGANGRYGALEPLVWLYWRTRNPRALALARRIADLDRESGGVAWLTHGKDQKDHLHSCLTTVRGFPWLYAATGERSYLEDAVAACDRVADWCTWSNGSVAEIIHPAEPHRFKTDETCCVADEVMLSYHLGDITGEGRFYDRADLIYYNGIRFNQWFNGNFNTYSDPYRGLKGPDNWWCCTWWGAKALYEVARHLCSSSPGEVHLNGFMPSRARVSAGNGSVQIDTDADIPRHGVVRLDVTPRGTGEFALNVRVPAWAKLQKASLNGKSLPVREVKGYFQVGRVWKAENRVRLAFDLLLRVVLDKGCGPTPNPLGKVRVDDRAASEATSILIYRGPVLLAQFRLQNGCDLVWAYTGDEPHLFETTKTVADQFSAGGAQFRHGSTPELVEVRQTPDGVQLAWEWKTGPGGAWVVKRSALVRAAVPVQIEYAAEIVIPPAASAASFTDLLETGRFCGVRMKWQVSEPSTYYEKRGYLKQPRMTRGRNALALETDSIRYEVASKSNRLTTAEDREAAYSAIYCVPERVSSGKISAACWLAINGSSRFNMPRMPRPA